MEATEYLMEEHRLIEQVLDTLELAAKRLASGQTVPADFFLKAADFIKNFADDWHHGKEEGVLFEALTTHGMSKDNGPVAVMLAEHNEGRRLTDAMRSGAERMQQGDASAAPQIAKNAMGYVMLLRQHIQKEDQILYPMADQLIPVAQHKQILAAFGQVENKAAGGTREKYLALASEMQKAMA
ncbi:MAG: hemerythrin domain-containing protein [Georgfuchsia sp.]